jgi:hypothetical protein
MPTYRELDNLVGTGALSKEPPTPGEVEGLQKHGEAWLRDASNPKLSQESRFNLAYDAAHAFARAALRRLGYRNHDRNRYLAFQVLEHTLGLSTAKWRVLAKAHKVRNSVEYDGELSIDERLVEDVIEVAGEAARLLAETRKRK